MKRLFYILLIVILVLFISVLPNIPLPFDVPVTLNALFLSIYNRITEYMPFILLTIIISIAIVTFLIKKFRKQCVRVLLFCFLFVVICFLSETFFSPFLRDYSKSQIIKKNKALIDALEVFKNKNNLYPESHHFLVPDFLKEIPKSNVLSIRNVEYRKYADDYTLTFRQYINGWDHDVLIFRKSGNYSDFGEELKVFAEWRYYHYQKDNPFFD